MPPTLRSRLIRLAHANPALRAQLLPLLRQAGEKSWPPFKVGDTVTLRRDIGIGPDRVQVGKEGLLATVVDVAPGKAFTPNGPDPFIDRYTLQLSQSDKIVTLTEHFWTDEFRRLKRRDPIEEAFQQVLAALREKGLLSQFKRAPSLRRLGRSLVTPPHGTPVPLEDVQDALKVLHKVEDKHYQVYVPTGNTERATYLITLNTGLSGQLVQGMEMYWAKQT